MKPASAGFAACVATAVIAVAACGVADPFRVLDDVRVVERVILSPDSVTAAVRDTVTLTASAIGRDDRKVTEAKIDWTSGDPSVARSIGEGRFVVIAMGSAEVFATTRGQRGRARVVVSR